MDWRDLHVALWLGRHKNLSAVGTILGMDPTTVRRRILQLEAELGQTLFVKDRRKWLPTEAGKQVLAHVEAMAGGARQIKHLDFGSKIQGRVRLTTVDAVANWLLLPALSKLRTMHPGLTLEIRCTELTLDLHASRADVGVRLVRPEEAGLRIKKLMDIELGLFASASYATRLGLGPDSLHKAAVDLLLYGPEDLPESSRALAAAPLGHVACVTASLNVLWDMTWQGYGLGVLPVSWAKERGGLVRLDDWHGERRLTRGLWRAVPEALVDSAKVGAVAQWIDGAAQAAQDAMRPVGLPVA